MRTCGECRLCCKVFPLPVLDKPGDEWCRFAGPSGCSIHDCGQPAVCREYACYWLEHEEWADALRPDRLGIVVTDRGRLTIGDCELPVLLFNQEHARACRRRPARAMIGKLVAQGAAVMLLCGPDMRLTYDKGRYPAISAQDIEIALRVDQSGDAEELKRLGAVPDDYRALSREEASRLHRLAQAPYGQAQDHRAHHGQG
jgi:uncharacterized protein